MATQPDTTIPAEEWRAIPGWEGFYEVSNQGRVRSLDRVTHGRRYPGRVMHQSRIYGYAVVSLNKRSVKKTVRVHRAVLEAFVGPPPLDHVGCHIDGDKEHGVLSNLKWATQKENIEDCRRHGTLPMGERHGLAKMTAERIIQMRLEWHGGAYPTALGRKFGISARSVWEACTGRTWRHVPMPTGIPAKRTNNRRWA